MSLGHQNRWDRNLVFGVPKVCPERMKFYTEVYRESEGLPAIARMARAFKKTLEEMTIFIEPEHLLAGNLTGSPVASPIWPEFGVTWLEKELDGLDKRPFDKFTVSEDAKKQIRELTGYWKDKGREEIIVKLTSEVLPENEKPAFDSESYGIGSVIYSGYNKSSGGAGHNVLNYEKALKIGFKGILKEAEEALASLSFNDRDIMKKTIFLNAVITCLKAGITFAKRYAALARTLADEEKNAQRKLELKQIGEICNHVPENPARSYWEALQAIWFMHVLRWVESNGHSVSVGRLDQFLYPYYQKDIEAGTLTKEDALVLMENLFVKIAGVKRMRPWTDTVYKAGYPTFQGITIGGQTPEGLCAVNELSYLILEATARLRLPEPVVICRVYSETPDEFLVKGTETLVRHGGGLPAFFSDETIVSAMQNDGVPLEQARNYGNVPCAGVAVPGKHIDHVGSDSLVNLAKVLEIACNGGTNPDTGLRLCPDDRDLATFNSFDDVWDAYKKQVKYYMHFVPIFGAISCSLYAELNPSPFASSLIDYRIEMGKDMNEGGGPTKDNSDHVSGHGVANVADALAAIKTLIFEEKRVTGKELKEVLANNFEGARGEEIRNMVLKVPKYGNGIDSVDDMAALVAKHFNEELKKCGPSWRGGSYGTSFQGITANVPEGQMTGATPDGRKSREPLADNISPSAGVDINGVTAMLRSVAKLDHSRYRYGNILNVKFHPTALKGDGVKKLASLIRTYLVDLKGYQLQFNIVSADTLKEAQMNPEKYKDLVVKVAGYCAQFISLDKRLQDQIIFRTEHVL
ncbi:glycyl radical protein [Chloroflexota bacterium]